MVFKETSSISLRKVWSVVGMLVFIGYSVTDLIVQNTSEKQIEMQGGIKWVIMTIVGFYFGRGMFEVIKKKVNGKDK